MRYRSSRKRKSYVSLSQKNMLEWLSDLEDWMFRKYNPPKRAGNQVLICLARSLAYGAETKRFPPRSWGWSCVDKEWRVLQDRLRTRLQMVKQHVEEDKGL